MVGLERTERAIKNRKTTDSQHWAQNVERRSREKIQRAKKTKMTNTNITKTC
jgi:hypothetical protein